MMKIQKTKGFTLIELLIVVAIIAILAAIAIPNFLAAQVRAKVSACKGGIRSLAIALEAYDVDNNQYVTNLTSDPLANTYGSGCEQALYPLTTPIAYISSVPHDPFINLKNSGGWPSSFVYYCDGTVIPQSWEPCFYTQDWVWAMWSIGPDQYSSWFNPEPFQLAYDPSNGTVSNGDIGRFGP